MSVEKCGRCGASLFEDDGDLVCINGHRRLEAASPNGHGRATNGAYIDPFQHLIKVMQEALDEVRRDLAAAESSIGERRSQAKRIEKAMQVLTAATPAPGATKRTRGDHAGRPRGGATAKPCPECGEHPNSKIHKAHKNRPVEPAVV